MVGVLSSVRVGMFSRSAGQPMQVPSLTVGCHHDPHIFLQVGRALPDWTRPRCSQPAPGHGVTLLFCRQTLLSSVCSRGGALASWVCDPACPKCTHTSVLSTKRFGCALVQTTIQPALVHANTTHVCECKLRRLASKQACYCLWCVPCDVCPVVCALWRVPCGDSCEAEGPQLKGVLKPMEREAIGANVVDLEDPGYLKHEAARLQGLHLHAFAKRNPAGRDEAAGCML
eukprot:1160415-Pelagomonas_calceolata.AAC.4